MGERVFLGLGANLGDRVGTLRAALASLRATEGVHVAAVSPVYESEPVGPVLDQPPFLNAVCELSESPAPPLLLCLTRAIEQRAGRERRPGAPSGGPRTLDIDLLLFGERLLSTPELVLPHPRFAERLFVLLPLLDLAPSLCDPRNGAALRERASAIASSHWCVRTDVTL